MEKVHGPVDQVHGFGSWVYDIVDQSQTVDFNLGGFDLDLIKTKGYLHF
jgi:hypothetical protein